MATTGVASASAGTRPEAWPAAVTDSALISSGRVYSVSRILGRIARRYCVNGDGDGVMLRCRYFIDELFSPNDDDSAARGDGERGFDSISLRCH